MTGGGNCPYCDLPAVFLSSSESLYNSGKDWGPMWVCPRFPACDAYVGCHKGTTTPLGRLARKELRRLKNEAHAAFDLLWRYKIERDGVKQGVARGAAYKWLAEQIGVPAAQCHIGMFDEDQCRRVVEVCAPYARRIWQKQNTKSAGN